MSNKVPYNSPTKSGNPGVVKKTQLSSSTVTFSSGLQDEISQLLNNFSVTNINALSKQLLAGAENAPTKASDNVLLPIQMLDKELGLKRLLFMLNLTMKELIKDDRGPHGPHIEDENDIWDHVVVLTYIFLDKMYPKIEALCDDDGFFRPKNITGLVDELRGVYRMFVSNDRCAYVKTGLSNVVETGVIGRMYIQCSGVVVEDDEEYDEDKKKISLKEARDYLMTNQPEHFAVYLSVDESMELVNNDLLLLEIVNTIAMLSPAFYWDGTLYQKRNEEITNYLMEALFASFFPGKAGFIMEMVLNLGTTSLRHIMTQPSTEINAEPIKFLRSLFLAAGEPVDLATWIKLILSWQHTTQALRQKQLDTNNVEVDNIINTMIRPFHVAWPAGFLNKHEFQTYFNLKLMPHEDCSQSITYAEVVKVRNVIVDVLISSHDDEYKKSEIITAIKSLNGLPRYDEPKMDDAYKNKCINVVTSAINDDANSGTITNGKKKIQRRMGKSLTLGPLPVPLTIAILPNNNESNSSSRKKKSILLVDPTHLEEDVASGNTVTVVCNTNEEIVEFHKKGSESRLTMDQVTAVGCMGFGRAKELEKLVLGR